MHSYSYEFALRLGGSLPERKGQVKVNAASERGQKQRPSAPRPKPKRLLALVRGNLYIELMSLPEPLRRLTEAEYLEIERAANFKSEFFEGEIFAMAGGTPQHSLIATNLAREFGNRLKSGNCVPYNADLRIKIAATGLCTYPDLSIICGPLQLAEGTDDTVLNPTLLVEVLSGSTEAYDRGKKFEHYRQIPSCQEYLLVSQHEPRIEQFSRQADGRWVLNEAAGLKALLELPSLRISVSLAEVFAKVIFVPSSIRAGSPRSRSHESQP
jgi:Uma2 family endonuclease